MLITRVTITGADDNTDVEDLKRLTKDFPFVEWAILIANQDREGTERYPTLDWRMKFSLLQSPYTTREPYTAAHLCGGKVEEYLDYKYEVPLYDRIQLNVREVPKPMAHKILGRAAYESGRGRDIIVPIKASTQDVWKDFHFYPNITYLYDSSGGRGQTPKVLRRPISGVRCGYAGGLGPDNIKDMLKMFSHIVEQGLVWIDMESNVRTDGKLDMAKVEHVLKEAKQYAT
jgi:hypothetical protein